LLLLLLVVGGGAVVAAAVAFAAFGISAWRLVGLSMWSTSSAKRSAPLSDTYITLWLHQVHRWFQGKRKVADFLTEAKDAGFTSVMGDVPWEWTEVTRGEIDLNSYGKTWMRTACDMGFRLHVVLTMRELPPWLRDDPNRDQYVEVGQSLTIPKTLSGTPSLAHPYVWALVQNFTKHATMRLVSQYGPCLETISPTWNNEFETRYVQTRLLLRDYSTSSVTLYRKWLDDRALPPKEPPVFSSHPVCSHTAMTDDEWSWLAFRQEFLVGRYESLCRAVSQRGVSCLLHFGEFFATITDRLHSTPFFDLAQSPHVGHLVMDSNMALSGAPASPSIVGIMVSAAQRHNKTVHYEAATERIIDCEVEVDAASATTTSVVDWENGSPLLLRRGVEYALDAGVQSIGVTNLRQPGFFRQLLDKVAEDDDDGAAKVHTGNARGGSEPAARLNTALPFRPTAILYVPYQAFAGWFLVVSEYSCSAPKVECWHESFRNMTYFGAAREVAEGKRERRNPDTGMGCPVDIAQYEVSKVWDDLRTRHDQVAVIGDVSQLTDELLRATSERAVLWLSDIMDGPGPWAFHGGEEAQRTFTNLRKKYRFSERRLSLLYEDDKPARPKTTYIDRAGAWARWFSKHLTGAKHLG
jgi:hypothetical protein